jgi:hypothetical protein
MTLSIPEPQSHPNPARAVIGRKAFWMLRGFFGALRHSMEMRLWVE